MFSQAQNLNENGRSIFLHGRAWLGKLHSEWQFFSKHIGFALTMNFGSGEDDNGITLHIAIPFLVSFFFIISGVCRTRKERHTGIAIHGGAIWFYILPMTMESNSDDPWWAKTYCWNFPWTLDWYSTEILEHKAFVPCLQGTVWIDRKGDKTGGTRSLKWKQQDEAAASVSDEHDYTYVLKNGKTQHVRAKIHVTRMTWKARWYPLIPRIKSSTSIDVRFSDEVGERAGSWKGGCIGCSYEMKHGETPWDTLKRMEQERKFN